MTRLLWELDQAGVAQIWLDARRPSQNLRDQAMVQALRSQRVIGSGRRVDFARSEHEPMLWIPDIVAGAVSAAYGDGQPGYLGQLRSVLAEPIVLELT